MPCTVCGRNRVLCGAEFHPDRGAYLSESSCHDGVWMDDDVYCEGWERDVLYPPCPHNPAACDCIKRDLTLHELHTMSCGVCIGEDDCKSCGGSGWKDQKWQWPVSADDLVDVVQFPTDGAA